MSHMFSKPKNPNNVKGFVSLASRYDWYSKGGNYKPKIKEATSAVKKMTRKKQLLEIEQESTMQANAELAQKTLSMVQADAKYFRNQNSHVQYQPSSLTHRQV